MDSVKAEIVTRMSEDVWVRSLMNGGCGLIKNNSEPAYDNQVKAVLRAAEGLIDLSLTENHYHDRTSKFVDASVNFRDKGTNLIIRVDNQIPSKEFHYNVKENNEVIANHTPIPFDSSALPLNFALKKVLEYFAAEYSKAKKPWSDFKVPPVTVLGDLLTFNEKKTDGACIFPVTLLGYPGSQIAFKLFSRKRIALNLVPIGFVLEKQDYQ